MFAGLPSAPDMYNPSNTMMSTSSLPHPTLPSANRSSPPAPLPHHSSLPPAPLPQPHRLSGGKRGPPLSSYNNTGRTSHPPAPLSTSVSSGSSHHYSSSSSSSHYSSSTYTGTTSNSHHRPPPSTSNSRHYIGSTRSHERSLSSHDAGGGYGPRYNTRPKAAPPKRLQEDTVLSKRPRTIPKVRAIPRHWIISLSVFSCQKILTIYHQCSV